MGHRLLAIRPELATQVILAVCAIGLTALVVRREIGGNERPRPNAIGGQVDDAERFASAGNRIGSPAAPVVIVVFSDYQCPFCRAFDESVSRLIEEHPGRVSAVFRNYPLEGIHPFAYRAALRAECAQEQGKFARMHKLLFALRDSLGAVSEEEVARRSGVTDVRKFVACVSERRYSARIASDIRAAGELHVRMTPTAVVHGQLVEGAIEFPALQELALGRPASLDRR